MLGGAAEAGHWAAWCVLSTVVTLSQPAVAQAFPPGAAGRALSAFNLVIFSGVFVVQWSIGLVIEWMLRNGSSEVHAFRWAMGGFCACCTLAYVWFVFWSAQAGRHASDNAA